MNRVSATAILCVCLLAVLLGLVVRDSKQSARPVMAAGAAPNFCAFPGVPAATPEQTSWQLFVAANCPTNDASTPLTWETWPTQESVYAGNTLSGAEVSKHVQRFHPTVQGRLLNHQLGSDPSSFSAKLLTVGQCTVTDKRTGRTICEEVRLNPVAATYVRQNGLNTLMGQGQFVRNGRVMDFQKAAVEVKADWLQNCNDAGLHTEVIDGKSYCLVAMHINSKLLPNWIWATFESRGNAENPNRCVTLGCVDSFGSSPAAIPSGEQARRLRNLAVQTPALMQMESAAQFPVQMTHYTMDGAQVNYLNGSKPTLLGNSVTEEELANVPLQKSSCITCHATSNVNAKGQQSFAGLNSDPIGKPPQDPSGYFPRDFVWSMVVAK
jgi:hypothetical protein